MEIMDTRGVLRYAKAQLSDYTIYRVVEKFRLVMDEFLAVVESLTAAPTQYRAMLNRLVTVLCDRFDIQRQIMYVRASGYATDVWGPLYWRFFHYASILITYMYEKNEINDMLDFPILVYNINHILPCNVCEAHYMGIKNNAAVRSALKEMSFGNLMTGLQMFHNLVTANIDSVPPRSNLPPRPPFTPIDFARTYECLELADTGAVKSLTYIRNTVDWQPPTHRILAILYAVAKKINYYLSSRELKAYYERLNRNDSDDGAIEREIERAIKLELDKDILQTNLPIIEHALVELYTSFPTYTRRVMSNIETIIAIGKNNETNKDVLTKLLDRLSQLSDAQLPNVESPIRVDV